MKKLPRYSSKAIGMFGHHEVAYLEIHQAGADNLGLNSCRDGRRGHIVFGSDHDEVGAVIEESCPCFLKTDMEISASRRTEAFQEGIRSICG